MNTFREGQRVFLENPFINYVNKNLKRGITKSTFRLTGAESMLW
jgi:hypothetical protein